MLFSAVVLVVSLGSAELVGWIGFLTSGFQEYARHIPWQSVLVAVAAEKSVAHM